MRGYAPHTFGDDDVKLAVSNEERKKIADRALSAQYRARNGATPRDDPWVKHCPACDMKTWDIGTRRNPDGTQRLETFCVTCLRIASGACATCGKKLRKSKKRIVTCGGECAAFRDRNRYRRRSHGEPQKRRL